MAKSLHTEILIQASPEKVWTILTSFNQYKEWNPFITSLEGDVAVGKKIKVQIEPPNGKAMTFSPTVLTYEKNKSFSWLGHVFINGLFDGEHRFELIDNQNGTTTLKHSEKFKGILLFLFGEKMERNTKKGFESMNALLKKRAEQL